MKDYLNIATKIMQTPWLITPEGLKVITSIFDERVKNGRLSDEEIEFRLEQAHMNRQGRTATHDAPGGVGILPLVGPIFGKANLMTEMSGATSLETFAADLDNMLNDPKISSIVMQIDSPGGTSDLVKETGDKILAGRDIKPIYAIADTITGSAAYWLMSQATAAYSTPSGSVGSVGAYTVHEDQSVNDAQQGKKYTFISAGDFKTEGNPHEPLSQAGIAHRQEVINELYDEFVGAIATGRNIDASLVKENFGQGRMLSASKALESGMIDGIMPFDNLVGNLATQPRQVTLQIDGRKMAAYIKGNMVEVAEWEHSDAGVSSPPPQKLPESTDPAIESGSRRSPLPLDKTDPGAPQAKAKNKKESSMDEAQLNALMELYGVDTEDKLIAAIQADHAEAEKLKAAVATSTKEKLFAEQFPQEYEQHMSLIAERNQRNSQVFAASVSKVTKPEGEKLVPTTLGLSALAIETVEEAHTKFAQSIGTVEDFENCIKVMVSGVVDYGEHGSSKLPDDPAPLDTTTAQGVANARQLFADKVSEIMTADSLEYSAAMAEAAKRYPDLANAYRATSAA